MEEQINEITTLITTHGLTLLAAFAIFIIGKWVVGLITKGVGKALQKGNTDPTLANFLKIDESL